MQQAAPPQNGADAMRSLDRSICIKQMQIEASMLKIASLEEKARACEAKGDQEGA